MKPHNLERITNPEVREIVYSRRKNALFRRATELSSMCDCEIAIIMFGPDGELAQFASNSMESTLKQYSRSCTQTHETHTATGIQKRIDEFHSQAQNTSNLVPSKRRHPSTTTTNGLHAVKDSDFDISEGQETADAILAMQNLPALPKGTDEHIDREFEKLMEDRAKRAKQGNDDAHQQPEAAAATLQPVAAPYTASANDTTLAQNKNDNTINNNNNNNNNNGGYRTGHGGGGAVEHESNTTINNTIKPLYNPPADVPLEAAANTIDSLAAVLAGNDFAPLTLPKTTTTTTNGQVEGENPADTHLDDNDNDAGVE